MALFLGILNYAAEKKKHIVPNQKRNRTVIMDNPFGKASSDHVLSPVFFRDNDPMTIERIGDREQLNLFQ